MGELFSSLVTFTEPMVIGAFALAVHMLIAMRCPGELSFGMTRNAVSAAGDAGSRVLVAGAFVYCAVAGTTSEYTAAKLSDSRFHVLDSALHDKIIEGLDDDSTIKITTLCGLSKSRYSERELEGLLYEMPWSTKFGTETNNSIVRATYSTRLLRGVATVSLVWVLILACMLAMRMFRKSSALQKSEDFQKQRWYLAKSAASCSAMTLVFAFAWYGAELEFHRAMRYDSLRFLLISGQGSDVCASLRDGKVKEGKDGSVKTSGTLTFSREVPTE